MTLDEEKLDRIAHAMEECGRYAVDHQKGINVTAKADGSPVTPSDLFISHTILSLVHQLFPQANVISEEETTPFSDEVQCTFILDPIDGTEMYQQGFPSWAIALGILDERREPVGAMIFAPRFGLSAPGMFLRLDPGKPLLLNGSPFQAAKGKDIVKQIVIGSGALKHISVSGFPGKIRCFGSSILHFASPVVFGGIQACAEFHGYVWDVAASHAVLRSQGMDIVHADGTPLRYDDAFLVERKPYAPPVFAGTKPATEFLRHRLFVTC
ncbi:MAG: inositol monophosphatase [Sphaerochaeta sp.]|nr:inositol monophosphatase [Sphaerochaeta sp.]MCH3920893.1 inositol monophosphatase [Sphaerochaeta sp.]MCI2096693.1 inositol monophosphatase [Sphaerochaeta sp.]